MLWLFRCQFLNCSRQQQRMSQNLPSREANQYRKMVRSYEQKQYKTALKLANQILNKVSTHGETLAMKGLIVNAMGKKDEALDLVKKGLQFNLKSSTCWHVYGMIERSHRNYEKSKSAFTNALRNDPSNQQILRDYSLLQIQLRDYDGFRDSRYQLLPLNPGRKASWVGYALGLHLSGNYSEAIKTLFEIVKFNADEMTYEQSELILYTVNVMVESGDTAGAVDLLEKQRNFVLDRLQYSELHARLSLDLLQRGGARGSIAEVVKEFEQLIERNPENKAWIEKLLTLCGDRLACLNELESKYPRSKQIKLTKLNYLEGEQFYSYAMDFVRSHIEKGVPPLFHLLKRFYSPPHSKGAVFERIFNEILQCLEEKEPPTTLFWLYFSMAQHCDRLGNREEAIRIIERCIEILPTSVEAYMEKARIYKHANALQNAVLAQYESQALDTADRYLNYKCVKYQLRYSLIEEAEELSTKFTRDGSSAANQLKEMQCLWWLCNLAHAYFMRRQFGEALLRCVEVDRIFNEFKEDQFDFHSYCHRKMTLTSYVKMLRMEDGIHANKYFCDAACLGVAIYIDISDGVAKNGPLLNGNVESMSESEIRKAKSKARKKAAALENKDKNNEVSELHDLQLDAKLSRLKEYQRHEEIQKLFETSEPLVEASKLLRNVLHYAPSYLPGHLLAFELYWRRGSSFALPLLKSVAISLKIAKEHFQVKINAIKLLEKLDSEEFKQEFEEFPDLLKKVVNDWRIRVFVDARGGADIETCRVKLFGNDGDSDPMVSYAAIYLDSYLGRCSAEEATAKLSQSTFLDRFPQSSAIEFLDKLSRTSGVLLPSAATISTIRRHFHSRFPLADAFKEAQQLADEKAQLLEYCQAKCSNADSNDEQLRTAMEQQLTL